MEEQGARIGLRLLEELGQYGEFNVRNCFSCGHCTAVCNIVQEGEGFPRRVVRYAQLGLRDQLAAARSVWSCYYCGECTAACPRGATPGQLMDAARRYFIVQWDVTTLSRRFYASPGFTWIFMSVLAAVLAILFFATGGGMTPGRPAFFDFMRYGFLHYLGIALMVLVALVFLLNFANMARQITRGFPASGQGPGSWIKDGLLAGKNVVRELAIQRRFDECRKAEPQEPEPWYLSRRVMHLSIMWGFLGLLFATAFDFLLKAPGSAVPLYYPARAVGTLAGLLLLFGLSLALWLRRERRGGVSFEKSYFSDWFLLWLLWAITLSGFLAEIVVYLPRGYILGYLIFLAHVILALELIILLPFTKFSHVIYRPAALYLHALLMRRRARCSPSPLPASRYRPGRVDTANWARLDGGRT